MDVRHLVAVAPSSIENGSGTDDTGRTTRSCLYDVRPVVVELFVVSSSKKEDDEELPPPREVVNGLLDSSLRSLLPRSWRRL
jgi:hypothetical protein